MTIAFLQCRDQQVQECVISIPFQCKFWCLVSVDNESFVTENIKTYIGTELELRITGPLDPFFPFIVAAQSEDGAEPKAIKILRLSNQPFLNFKQK
jgi:hypothetical protein